MKVRRRRWHPTPVFLPGKSHGWRSLVGWSPWGLEESDTTEWLHIHFSLSWTGEGNGNPLQCSCLENPRNGEPGGLPSMGSHRVGHDWSDLAAAAAAAIKIVQNRCSHWPALVTALTQYYSLRMTNPWILPDRPEDFHHGIIKWLSSPGISSINF